MCFTGSSTFFYLCLFSSISVKQEESRAAVREVHDLLATVCEESGLQGLEYTGGPLCPHCPDSRSVLPLVKYDKDGRGEPALEKVACDEQTCRMPCDAVKLLIKVSKYMYLSGTYTLRICPCHTCSI